MERLWLRLWSTADNRVAGSNSGSSCFEVSLDKILSPKVLLWLVQHVAWWLSTISVFLWVNEGQFVKWIKALWQCIYLAFNKWCQ